MTPTRKKRGKKARVTKPRSTAIVVASSTLTDEEAKFVAKWEANRGVSPPPLVDVQTPTGVNAQQDPAMHPDLWSALLARATGSNQDLAQLNLLIQLKSVFGRHSTSPSVHAAVALSHMLDIAPQNGLEGMLAVQMVSAHRVAMTLLAQGTNGAKSIELADFCLRNAERLIRLFAIQVDALGRLRGKGPSEQKVTVQHVHVHDGGQAVVGNVATASKSAPGGGDDAAPV